MCSGQSLDFIRKNKRLISKFPGYLFIIHHKNIPFASFVARHINSRTKIYNRLLSLLRQILPICLSLSLHLNDIMGINLIPTMDGYRISTENFTRKQDGGDGSVDLGCINKGNHRVLRFNLHTRNIGDTDLVIGRPEDRPDIFEPSTVFATGFQFRTRFFVYNLRNDDSSIKISGYKIPFCFDALPPSMSCENQGIAAGGGEDVYESELPCQFVVIDNLADGEYILEATVNAPSVDAAKSGKGKILFEEDNYDDNTLAVRLQIKGANVTQL